MAQPLGTSNVKSKDHRRRKNGSSAEAFAKLRLKTNNTPERKTSQLMYRIEAINNQIKAGRGTPELEKDLQRLCDQLQQLSLTHPVPAVAL